MAALNAGAALAGCSAGAMAMTAFAPYVRELDRAPEPGLGVLPGWQVLPHFDRFQEWEPTIVERSLAALPVGIRLLGIDEETALVQLDGAWVVHGRQAVWDITAEGHTPFRAGEALPV